MVEPAIRPQPHRQYQSRLATEILRRLDQVLPVGDGPYPLHEPLFAGNEKKYLAECIDTGWVSSAGPFVERFEAELSSFTGLHAVACVNGTAALHTCLLLSGVSPDDEVLVPTVTFVATANAVSYCGAVPHFVDSEADTLGVDPDRLAAYLDATLEPRNDDVWRNKVSKRPVRALIVTHIFGHPPKLDRLKAVADQYGIALIEDAAEALGTFHESAHAGSIGDCAALSFNGNKTITAGGGGAIITRDPDVARQAKHLTTTARVADGFDWTHDTVGYNYRLPNINAALACAQLEQLPRFLAAKRRLADDYIAAFDDLPEAAVISEQAQAHSNYWLNTLLLKEKDRGTRDHILTETNSTGYHCRPLWTPMHRLPMYRDCPAMELTTAQSLFESVISLPSGPALRLG